MKYQQNFTSEKDPQSTAQTKVTVKPSSILLVNAANSLEKLEPHVLPLHKISYSQDSIEITGFGSQHFTEQWYYMYQSLFHASSNTA